MRSVLLFLVTLAAFVAQLGSLTGSVRDEQGAPIAGAQITVRSETSPTIFSTTTDEQGAYNVSAMPAGDYRVESARNGYATSYSEVLSIKDGAETTLPVTMGKTAAAHPQFEAAGVRGLIDPGGYSAAGNAAAASGLIKGIADIKRTGNEPATSPTGSMPCALEPALQREVEQKPESDEASLKLGEFYLSHGQVAKAIPILERARTLNQGNLETLRQLADAYLQAGRFDAAQTLLAPSVLKDRPEMHRLVARADEGSGHFTQASQEYQLAASRDPSEENLFGAGYELILAGLPADAEQAFAAGLTRYSRSIELNIGRGSAQFLQGHQTESIQTLLHAIDLDPADPRPYPFLAQASGTARDDADRVHAAFEHFLNLAPKDARASYYLALNLSHTPQADLGSNETRMETLLKRALELDPGLADAHYQLGVFFARRHDYQGSAHELESALRLSPNLKEAHYRLAMVYRQTGRPDLAVREMQRFREAEERSPAQKGGMGVDIEQFISVFRTPDSLSAHETLCPGDSY